MDLFGWLGLVVLCSWSLRASSTDGMGRKFLSELNEANPILMEMGYWDIFLCIWAMFAIFAILAISMERSKNIGKGKAPSFSMERAVKKRKADTSQTVKKGKGKRRDSSSESEEASECDDEEIEAMFAESSDLEREKWAQSITKRGFHYERGVKVDTFLFTHPIRAIIQEQNLQFVCAEAQGYLPTLVREFYANLRENQRVDTLLETTIMGKQLKISPDSIAHSLQYVRPIAHERPYPLRAITEFHARLYADAMCTHPVAIRGFMRKEFVQGKLKPEYALMNKIIHNMIGPKEKEKFPSKEEIQFLYEVMTGKIIDYALVIWCVIGDFLQSPTENRHIPFPTLVTNLVEDAGMRGVVREKRILSKLGPITNQTEAKSRASSTRPQPSHSPTAISGASSSSAHGSMSTSPLKRMERRIKGWFKCILGKQKQLDHRLSRLESHIYQGEPTVGDAPPPDMEGDSDELDDCVDEDAFSSTDDGEGVE